MDKKNLEFHADYKKLLQISRKTELTKLGWKYALYHLDTTGKVLPFHLYEGSVSAYRLGSGSHSYI